MNNQFFDNDKKSKLQIYTAESVSIKRDKLRLHEMAANIKIVYQKGISMSSEDNNQGCMDTIKKRKNFLTILQTGVENLSSSAIDITSFNNLRYIYQEINDNCGVTDNYLTVEHEMTRMPGKSELFNSTIKYVIGAMKEGNTKAIATLSLPPFAIEYKVSQNTNRG